MIDQILNSNTLPLLEKMAAFAERRQEVLAGNIANIDTPGYKMRDLPVADFQQALQEAVQLQEGLGQPAARSSLSMPATLGEQRATETELQSLFPRSLFQARETSPQNLTFNDENNRSIEAQVMHMTKNSLMQQFAVETMMAQMNQLLTVISERA
ncbi:Flagellar basal body rod protein FlgB [Gimesia panareensis]|uniref:Flagellar basal body rod protein FlgB n=1 Tax=Gimesia panareensis TaxID=2527978 RepID=A0A518FL46_9PLAN|nr:flagellar basal body rod protein FlgB [Gimesia panareensis]QDV17019.1 Flagellar basal body rod protein FlgB [Gimesia panareensis]